MTPRPSFGSRFSVGTRASVERNRASVERSRASVGSGSDVSPTKASSSLFDRRRTNKRVVEDSDSDDDTSESSLVSPPTTPAMKRHGELSDIGEQIQEEVVAKSGVKPSAAFPVGTENIGPHSFRKVKLLGKGGAGTVYLVVLRGTDNVYAMKELTKEDMIARNKVMRVMTEREILASANHPFIVTMYATFQTSTRLCFVMDYCAGGEFFGVLARQPQKRLQEGAARFYAAEVLLALEYLHYLGFFYRDLKPENILMRASGHIALTDFDLSKQAQAVSPRMIEHQRTMMQKLTTFVGASKATSKLDTTLEYLAPELVKGENQNSTVDWWTFGILIYEMMTGTTPFRADKSEEVLAKITGSERVHWEGDVGSPEARKIVKKLLHRDPKKRLGAEHGATEIKKSAWFESVNFSLIRNEQPPIIPSDVPSLSDFDGIDIDREEAGAGRESDEGDKGEKAADSSGAFAAFDMHRDETGAFTRRDGAEPGQN